MDKRESQRFKGNQLYKIGYVIGRTLGWIILGLAALGLLELIK